MMTARAELNVCSCACETFDSSWTNSAAHVHAIITRASTSMIYNPSEMYNLYQEVNVDRDFLIAFSVADDYSNERGKKMKNMSYT